jgi:hypothetical protein
MSTSARRHSSWKERAAIPEAAFAIPERRRYRIDSEDLAQGSIEKATILPDKSDYHRVVGAIATRYPNLTPKTHSLHAIRFSKGKYPTQESAQTWLATNGFLADRPLDLGDAWGYVQKSCMTDAPIVTTRKLAPGIEAQLEAVDGFRFDVQFRKSSIDVAKRTVEGEVYVPHEDDDQLDWVSTEDVEKAAHDFLANGYTKNVDTNHNWVPNGSAVVESYIAKSNDPVYKPGTWVMKVRVDDDQTWTDIQKGKITGFSIAGKGTRVFDDPVHKGVYQSWTPEGTIVPGEGTVELEPRGQFVVEGGIAYEIPENLGLLPLPAPQTVVIYESALGNRTHDIKEYQHELGTDVAPDKVKALSWLKTGPHSKDPEISRHLAEAVGVRPDSGLVVFQDLGGFVHSPTALVMKYQDPKTKKKIRTQLTKLRVSHVSLVGSAANNRVFKFVKSKGPVEDPNEVTVWKSREQEVVDGGFQPPPEPNFVQKMIEGLFEKWMGAPPAPKVEGPATVGSQGREDMSKLMKADLSILGMIGALAGRAAQTEMVMKSILGLPGVVEHLRSNPLLADAASKIQPSELQNFAKQVEGAFIAQGSQNNGVSLPAGQNMFGFGSSTLDVGALLGRSGDAFPGTTAGMVTAGPSGGTDAMLKERIDAFGAEVAKFIQTQEGKFTTDKIKEMFSGSFQKAVDEFKAQADAVIKGAALPAPAKPPAASANANGSTGGTPPTPGPTDVLKGKNAEHPFSGDGQNLISGIQFQSRKTA